MENPLSLWLYGIITILVIISGLMIVLGRQLRLWIQSNESRQVWFLGIGFPLLSAITIFYLVIIVPSWSNFVISQVAYYTISPVLTGFSIICMGYLFRWRHYPTNEKNNSFSKLTLNNPRNLKKVEKGLLYLLLKTNQSKDVDLSTLKSVAKICAKSIFEGTNTKSLIDGSLKGVHLSKVSTLEYFIYLKRENYFGDKTSKIANAIFHNWPLKKNKGWGTSNLYTRVNLLKEKKVFDGLTSEIALKNEMNL